MNGSEDAEAFERSFRRVWAFLQSARSGGLSPLERRILHHIPPRVGVPLSFLCDRLGLPKSTTSVTVKGLERRGLLTRTRDERDERRLAIVLTRAGEQAVRADALLDPPRLDEALAGLSGAQRAALLGGLEQLARVAERQERSRREAAA